MNLKVISRNVGMALLVSALFMLLSVLISLHDGAGAASLLRGFCGQRSVERAQTDWDDFRIKVH